MRVSDGRAGHARGRGARDARRTSTEAVVVRTVRLALSVRSTGLLRRVEKAERDAILRQGVVLARDAARASRTLAALEEDLRTISLTGEPLPMRGACGRARQPRRTSSPRAGRFRYMLRLREIEQRTEAHEPELRDAVARARRGVRADARAFRELWLAEARRQPFDEVNDLVERHNRWYPVESRLPMDPRTRRLRARQRPATYRLAPARARGRWSLGDCHGSGSARSQTSSTDA